MADFNLPFATNGERREPTADEQDSGFGCGPAQLALFNWMFYALQAEINKVMLEGGITPSNGDMTQLWQAIQAMIDASTGGGDPSSYLLVAQARARLPIFSDVQNANGHFGVVSPGTGQVRIPAGVIFQHRGIFPITTVQTDFATDASKTYHIRWNPTDGFSLKDLASGTYNPATSPETDPKFDSTYDDMLVGRVITNSSNVPTITNLVNKDRLMVQDVSTGVATSVNPTVNPDYSFTKTLALNWARTPVIFAAVGQVTASAVQPGTSGVDGGANSISNKTSSRYQVAATVTTDWSYTDTVTGPVGRLDFSAMA